MMCIATAVNYCDTSFLMTCKLFRDCSVSLHIPHVVLQLCGIVLKKRSFDASREVFQGQSLAALHSAIYVETSFALCISNIMQEHKTFAAYWNFKDCGCRKMTAYGRKVKLIQFWPLMYDPCLYGLQSLWSAGSQLLLCPCHNILYFLVIESSQSVLMLDFLSTIIVPFLGNFIYTSTCSHENLHTGLWIKCKWSQRQAITSNRGRLILCDHYRQL